MAPLIRAARRSDTAAIATVNAAASPDLIQKYPGLVYVAEVDRSVAGYLALTDEAHPAVESHKPLQLWQIFVAPAFHGTGVATELMTSAFIHARHHVHDVVWLGVSEHNARAIAFYRKHGFTPLGLHKVGSGYHEHEDLLMICPVSKC
jgi:diamine N-acetyltransferase